MCSFIFRGGFSSRGVEWEGKWREKGRGSGGSSGKERREWGGVAGRGEGSGGSSGKGRRERG